MGKEDPLKYRKYLKKREYEKLLKARERWVELEKEISGLESSLKNASIKKLEKMAGIPIGIFRGSSKINLYNRFGLFKKSCASRYAAHRILKEKEGYKRDSISYEFLDIDAGLHEAGIEILELELSLYEGIFTHGEA